MANSSTLRQRKTKESPSKTKEPVASQEEPAVVHSKGFLSSIVYSLRQHGGFLLGTFAVFGTALTYVQEDEWKVQKILAWMIVACIALVIHELRPFKR